MSAISESLIGGVLIGGEDAYWRVADLIEPSDLPDVRLAGLWRVCTEVAKSSAGFDAVTVGEEAERQGVCRMSDVIDLATQTASAANVRGYAERVKQQAMERRVRAICAEGAKSGDVGTVQGQLTALLSGQPSAAIPASQALKRMWDGVMERWESKETLSGLPTGFQAIDELTGGLQPGRVYGIGARAKMGKTILAMNICANVALSGKPVAVWSLEMSDEELVQRMCCAVGGIPSMAVQHPKLLEKGDDQWNRLHVSMKKLRDAPLRISDRTDVTVEQIEAQARQMHASGQLDLLCIDYLGLLKLPKMDRHDLSIAHATRRIKIIAKELRIPVLLVFQLNRGSENGAQVRPPRPSDARDSGSIEQDLDAMFLLHRPSYYDKGAEAGLRLDLALQRNGPTGLIRLEDQLDRCRFVPSDREWSDPKASKDYANDL